MAIFESAEFCSIEEYSAYRDRRLMDHDLEVGNLYTYMMRLRDNEKHAAKLTARINDVVPRAGALAIGFDFLDEDLLIDFSATDAMKEGIIFRFGGAGVFVDNGDRRKYRLQEAYLRDYFEDQFDDYMRDASELSLTAS